jgi:spore coat polysaccharide biosynthesis protein SpsF
VKNLVILQARMSSTRLPGKVMEIVNGKPMIYWQIQRIQRSKIEKLIVATSTENSDDILAEYMSRVGIDVYRGPIDDVFNRFIGVLNNYDAENFIRLTADCPMIMPQLLDSMIDFYRGGDFDYVSNTINPSFPDGLDIEIVKTSAFRRLSQFDLSDHELEHVTVGMYTRRQLFKCENYPNTSNLSELRWTVDYPEDLVFVKRVFSHFKGKEISFDLNDLLFFVDRL